MNTKYQRTRDASAQRTLCFGQSGSLSERVVVRHEHPLQSPLARAHERLVERHPLCGHRATDEHSPRERRLTRPSSRLLVENRAREEGEHQLHTHEGHR